MRNGFEDMEDLPDLTVEESIRDSGKWGIAQDSNFDPYKLEGALKPLYKGAKSIELAAPILLFNLCIVHGVSNNFVEELFGSFAWSFITYEQLFVKELLRCTIFDKQALLEEPCLFQDKIDTNCVGSLCWFGTVVSDSIQRDIC